MMVHEGLKKVFILLSILYYYFISTDLRKTSQMKILDLRKTSQMKISDLRKTSQIKILDLRKTSQM